MKKHTQKLHKANILAILSAHIPCCGSKIIVSIFGAQALGAASLSYFYEIEEFIPLIITAILTLFFLFRQPGHHHHHGGDEKEHKKHVRHSVARFFILNLVIGYALGIFLHLFLPAHDHPHLEKVIHVMGHKDHESHEEHHDSAPASVPPSEK